MCAHQTYLKVSLDQMCKYTLKAAIGLSKSTSLADMAPQPQQPRALCQTSGPGNLAHLQSLRLLAARAEDLAL